MHRAALNTCGIVHNSNIFQIVQHTVVYVYIKH